MNTDGFLALLEASAPSSREALMAEYEGPLPAACDERYHNVCQAYRQLSPPERCEAEERMSTEQRDWMRAAPDRMAMLSVRLQAPAYLEDALIGAFMNFPVAVTDPLEFQGYRGILAICRRCAQLLGLGPEAFEGQMIYICRDDVRRDVREFMMGAASDQQPARWGFREETGDHGIVFRWGQLAIPEAWL